MDDNEQTVKTNFRNFILQNNLTKNIRQIAERGDALGSLLVDLQLIKTSDPWLLDRCIQKPADTIVFMDEVVALILIEEYPEVVGTMVIRVCLHNHPNVSLLRSLDPRHIDTLISIRGVVVRASMVIPEMHTAAFVCNGRVTKNQSSTTCMHTEIVPLAGGEVQEPLQCPGCNSKFSFEIAHERCQFGDKQLIKIQETPEMIPEGETPQTVMAYAYDDYVDVAKPGDRVEVVGVFRASGLRIAPRQRTLKSVYRTYIDINHVSKESSGRLVGLDLEGVGAVSAENFERQSDGHIPSLSPPENLKNEMLALVSQPEPIYSRLVKSFAPNIWEADDIKKGLLCQLFGGNSKIIGGRETRAEIHVLFCGDPSTAKSQLMAHVHQIAPRGVSTCGRGTSAVGLTASVSRDAETREFVLESGAIVLSDRGICCIDEFDKMDDGSRSVLHEVMEQQTVSVAKAGIVCSLNARTAILASANPIGSRYDVKKSVVENINLPPALLSRFDLIYLLLDIGTEENDRRLARHITSLYAHAQKNELPPLSREKFAKYISYARRYIRPILSIESGRELSEVYISWRRRGRDSTGKSLTASPRQLESLIRLSESLARMECSTSVSIQHVREASRLIQVATYSTLVDPLTGRIDFDQLTMGMSGAARSRRDLIQKLAVERLAADPSGVDRDKLHRQVDEALTSQGQKPLDAYRRELELLMKEMERTGCIRRTYGGIYHLGAEAAI